MKIKIPNISIPIVFFLFYFVSCGTKKDMGTDNYYALTDLIFIYSSGYKVFHEPPLEYNDDDDRFYIPNFPEPYTGEVKSYMKDDSTVLMKTSNFVKGKAHGLQYTYHPNGQLYYKIVRKKGKREGAYVQYHDNGAVYVYDTLTHDERRGCRTEYYTNGQLRLQKCKGKKLFGTADFYKSEIEYYMNGNLRSERFAKGLNKPHGRQRSFREDGTIEREDNYKNGKLNGDTRHYNNKGKLTSQNTYRNGEMNGKWIVYNANNDSIRSETSYQMGKQHGWLISYSDNGVLREKAHYQKGKLDGYKAEYYPTGIIKSHSHYKDDRIVGDWTEYDKEGRPERSGNYLENSVRHGVQRTYYNGILSTEYTFDHGKPIGRQKEYHYPTGELQREFSYNPKSNEFNFLNEYHGPYIVYYTNGLVERKFNYLYGKIDGELLEFYSSGKLRKKTVYANDVLVSESAEYASDVADLNAMNDSITMVPLVEYRTDELVYLQGDSIPYTGKVKSYLHGNLYGDGSYLNGKEEGRIEFFFPNGKTKRILHFKEGLLNGSKLEYYPDGKLQLEATYTDGREVGDYKTYYADGQLELETTYAQNEENAPRVKKEYYPNGQLRSETNYVGWKKKVHTKHISPTVNWNRKAFTKMATVLVITPPIARMER